MPPPTLYQYFRQVIGRAFRETGQSLDRAGVRVTSWATTKNDYYDDPVIFEDFLSRHRHQFPFLEAGRPVISQNVAFLAPCSTILGSVFISKDVSIWYGAVLRGDQAQNPESFDKTYEIESDDPNATPVQPWELPESRFDDQRDHQGGAIFIGAGTNIQDACLIRARIQHCIIGEGVTVGHLAQIDSAKIGNYCLIGMGSVIGPGVEIGSETLIAAGAVVPENTKIGNGELWVGSPAKKLRELQPDERKKLHFQSSEYVQVAKTHVPVMKLGGNVDANGSSVYVLPEEEVGLLEGKEWVRIGDVPENLPEPTGSNPVGALTRRLEVHEEDLKAPLNPFRW
jgi:carbonic anhydrase/acetyltransferase-like protein (isoleucine patch superfamily)